MDGVVDVRFAVEMGRLGGLAVLNLDGVQCRYEDPSEVLAAIAAAPPSEVKSCSRRSTSPDPGWPDRPADRGHQEGRRPLRRLHHPRPGGPPGRIVQEAGADCLVVQGTVLTARHISHGHEQLSFRDLTSQLSIRLWSATASTMRPPWS